MITFQISRKNVSVYRKTHATTPRTTLSTQIGTFGPRHRLSFINYVDEVIQCLTSSSSVAGICKQTKRERFVMRPGLFIRLMSWAAVWGPPVRLLSRNAFVLQMSLALLETVCCSCTNTLNIKAVATNSYQQGFSFPCYIVKSPFLA